MIERIVLRLCLAFALLGPAMPAWAQTCSIPGNAGTQSLSAQPNTFFPATASAGVGATSLSVGPGTGVNSGIQAGDLLLLIQMQGADLDTSDTNGYGDGSTSAGVTATVAVGAAGYAGGVSASNYVAGTYEWAVASGGGATFAAGGTINLSAPLTKAFATRASSTTVTKQAWQVIRVPQYANLQLAAGLTVQPWDGSSGGLLVLEATGDADLNGQTINGSGRGFRGAGAQAVPPQCTADNIRNGPGCPQYVSTIASQLGASKGEGVAGTPGRIYTGDPTGGGIGGTNINGAVDGYPGGEGSRGAPGNAGGGGNQHNAGGGGGANGGAGGQGGNSWNFSNTGVRGLVIGGFGGSPAGTAEARWLMGGGGGAGETGGNTWVSPDGAGGAGGALVVIRAGRVVGGGATISVNGAPGRPSTFTDAAGGGGAGGTVIVTTGTGGLSGAITVNANGGNGGNYTVAGAEQDGTGGGGGGGVLVTNAAGIVFNRAGGTAGTTASTACAPAIAGADCGQRDGSAGPGSAGYALAAQGASVGYECLPNLTLTKATGTPLVTASTGGTASYTLNVRNAGGGVRFMSLTDLLPPGWSAPAAATLTFAPAQPLAANNLASGVEAGVTVAAPGVWPTGSAASSTGTGNTRTLAAFAVAPARLGVPSSLTVTFIASIPDTATVGTYHNGAGYSFLDPTRASGSTRTVTAATNATANFAGASYGATTYANFAGAAATPVAGSNYNGLSGGPTAEDVRLVPDFSIVKTAPATASPGATFTYTLTPRNNGRPVTAQAFGNTAATTVAGPNVGSTLGSSPLTVTDTLPAGVTLTAAFNGTGWTCTQAGQIATCTLPNGTAWPAPAATDFALITATASLSGTCVTQPGARTNTVVVSTGAGETVANNNTATAVTAPACVTANLQVTKTNGVGTLVSGGTTSYTVTVANLAGGGTVTSAVVQDPVTPGLSCTAVTCAVTSGAGVCPASPAIGVLQNPGLTIPSLPGGSTLSFIVTCSVTATGL